MMEAQPSTEPEKKKIISQMFFPTTGINHSNWSQSMREFTAKNQFFHASCRYCRGKFVQQRKPPNEVDARWWKVEDTEIQK